MTNKDRLISLLGFSPANNHAIDGALTDAGIDGSEVYDGGNIVQLKNAAIEIMELLLSTPDVSNTEGQAIKYDRNAVLARIKQYKTDLGIIVEERATITAKQPW